MRHNATTSEELTVVQIQCVQTLMTGATITDAAKTAGIDRATIYRWLKTDAMFTTELNRLKAERLEAVQSEFRGLLSTAVTTVGALMTDTGVHPGTRLRAALAVVDRAGGIQPDSIGPVDVEEVKLDQAEAQLFDSLGRVKFPRRDTEEDLY
jgi:hypothetical protein